MTSLPSTDPIAREDALSQQPTGGPTESAAGSLVLLRELEASLLDSQRALLVRDLAGIERATQKQIGLQRALAALWRTDSGAFRNSVLPAAQRVLHLGRIQVALLARTRQSLNMLLRFAAGAQGTYEKPAENAAAGKGSLWQHEKGKRECRA